MPRAPRHHNKPKRPASTRDIASSTARTAKPRKAKRKHAELDLDWDPSPSRRQSRRRRTEQFDDEEEEEEEEVYDTAFFGDEGVGELCPIKDVLDEKIIDGRVAYLVDWEGSDPVTGQPYTPAWEFELTEGALLLWQKKKQANSQPSQEASHPDSESDENELPSQSDSQPSHSQPPSNILPQDFAVVSKIAVELNQGPALDPTEYLSVSHTQGSLRVSELEEEDSRAALASQISRDFVADSQEESDWAETESGSEGSLPASSELISQDQDSSPPLGDNRRQFSYPAWPPEESQEFVPSNPTELTSSPEQSQPPSLVSSSARLSPAPEAPAAPSSQSSSSGVSFGVSSKVGSGVASEPACQPTSEVEFESDFAIESGADHEAPSAAATTSQAVSGAARSFSPSSGPGEGYSVVIPDSQDQSSLNTQTKDTCASGSSLSYRDSSSQPQEVIPESSTLDLDIPSRKPDRQDRSQSESALASTATGRQDSGPPRSLSVIEFLTQPPPSPLTHDSLRAQVQEFIRITRDEYRESSSYSRNFATGSSTDSSPPVSRAAEVAQSFRHLFDQPSQMTYNSNASAGSNPPSPPGSQNPQPHDDKIASQPAESMSQPKSTPSPPREMKVIQEVTYRPGHIMEDVRKIFDIDNYVWENGDPIFSSANAETESHPATSAVGDAPSEVPQITVEISDPEAITRPLFQPGQLSVHEDGGQQFVAPQSISPAAVMNRPATCDPPTTSSLLAQDSHPIPATVSPAEISNSMDQTHTLIHLSDPVKSSGIDDSTGRDINMGQVGEHDYGSSPASITHDPSSLQQVVTLPFQASRRPFYEETIHGYKRDAEAFGRFFSSDTLQEPDSALVEKIDKLFSILFNICDYPQHLVGTSLEELPTIERAKYICDANPKFNFMYELLQGIDIDMEVLVVARTPELLRLHFALAEALELESVSEGVAGLNSSYRDTGLRLHLALPHENRDPYQYGLIVGFDHLFNSSPVVRRLQAGSPDRRPPLILHLVTTHSIEHINLRIPEDLSPVEKKNALLLGIAKAEQKDLILDPVPNAVLPHNAAEVFSDFLNGKSEMVVWEPQPIPDEVLAFFVNTQSQMPVDEAADSGRKRKHDGDGMDEEEAKRARVADERAAEQNDPPLAYPVRQLLELGARKDSTPSRGEALVSVPLATLERLAEHVAELRRRAEDNDLEAEYKATINRLQKQVRDHERSSSRIAESNRKALEDRTKFAGEMRNAQASLKHATEASEKQANASQARIKGLEETITRLTTAAEGPEAASRNLLKECEDKIQRLEKRLENAQKEADYVRSVYQEANTRIGSFEAENKELQARVQDLQKTASDNMVKIHQIQADNTIKAHLGTIEALKTRSHELEMELDRARDELRYFRSQRSTRQSSVPRSPRMPIMSPRLVRGSASRGTSPAPYEGNGSTGIAGMQFLSQPPNSRWGQHLRD